MQEAHAADAMQIQMYIREPALRMQLCTVEHFLGSAEL